MQKAWLPIKLRRLGECGFSPVEVLLAATVFGFLVTGLIGAIIYGRTSTKGSGDRAAAVQLADEGIQVVRNLRNGAYANLTNGTFGLAQVSNQWALSGSSDVTGIYTREVTIAANGTNRKNITSTVKWSASNGSILQVSLSSILSNWMEAVAAVKTWANAIFIGSYDAASTSNGYKVDSNGTYAYLIRNVTGTTNFFIINITNPAAPTLAGSLTLANTPTNIAVSGNYAYVSNSSIAGELQIVNVTNPAAPVLASTYNAAGTAGGGLSVAVSGNYAYLGRATNSASGEFTVVNVTNPAAPTLAGSYGVALAINAIALSGNYAYLATSLTTAEMRVINITNPAAPTLAGTFNTSNAIAATGITVFGTTAYIVTGTLITSVNITTPATPAQLGTYTLLGTGNATSLAIDSTGKNLFVSSANTTAEFRIINVTTPASMALLKTIDATGTTSTISGLDYDSAQDIVLAASASDTQELLIYGPN